MSEVTSSAHTFSSSRLLGASVWDLKSSEAALWTAGVKVATITNKEPERTYLDLLVTSSTTLFSRCSFM